MKHEANESYYSTGEFAKICGTNKQTLLFYDDIGLFSPKMIGDNGYHYYTPQQFDLFATIQALKEIGLPLKDIKSFISKRNPDSLLELLNTQKQALNRQIQLMQNLSKMIETKYTIVDNCLSIDTSQISIICMDTEYLMLSRSFKGKSEKQRLIAIAEHIKFRRDNQLHCGHALGGIVENSNSKNVNEYLYYYTKIDDPKDMNGVFEKESGNYLAAYHSGHYNTTYKEYPRILDFASKRNLKLGKFFFEESLIDEVAENDPDRYLNQILIQVL